ncbi:hypothetical protein LZ554_002173 [Drepanopeziza brunnea f. sp. 'monogermtubi']|nr:hypothetical protein LZ554_002173 [Drepanopeziza brunnea f. sp. 'monogermtubi']
MQFFNIIIAALAPSLIAAQYVPKYYNMNGVCADDKRCTVEPAIVNPAVQCKGKAGTYVAAPTSGCARRSLVATSNSEAVRLKGPSLDTLVYVAEPRHTLDLGSGAQG